MKQTIKKTEKRKRLSLMFAVLTQLLLCVGLFVVGYQYGCMQSAVAHHETSFPAYVAFFYAIPFAVAILPCALLWWHFDRAKS